MSIFAKADANLPFITQVMQVDLSNQTDIYQFWCRSIALAEIDQHQAWHGRDATDAQLQAAIVKIERDEKRTNAIFISGSKEYVAQAKAAGYETVREHMLSTFRHACLLAVKIVTEIYQTETVPFVALSTLRRMTQPNASQAFLVKNPYVEGELSADLVRREAEENERFISLSEFFSGWYIGTLIPTFYVGEQVEAALSGIGHGQFRPNRCDECANIFQASRTGQTYCSHRCANRVSQRRRDRITRQMIHESRL